MVNDKQFALIWFYARPDEWDALDPHVKENELASCGALIRSGLDYTWISDEY